MKCHTNHHEIVMTNPTEGGLQFKYQWPNLSHFTDVNIIMYSKPVYVVTSIKQSLALKGHFFSCPVI
jgi:hypothetical protein